MKNITDKLVVYSRSENTIWTDEHISKKLLLAHLDYDNDAASRNIKTIQKTINWIDSIAEGKKKLLDLGCGPGIYADLFSDRGYAVTGIDISKNSIDYAKNCALKLKKDITYINSNYVNEKINGKYDLAVCIYCDFGALIPNEQKLFLKNVYASLNEKGILILDVFGIDSCLQWKETRTWSYNESESFWCKEPHFILEEIVHFKEEMAWGRRILILSDHNEIKEYIIWDNYYTEDKIQGLLKEYGFEVEGINKTIVEENHFTTNDVMFIKARKT